MARALEECPDWRPGYLRGHDKRPEWFNAEYIRLFKPQISRILKKANKQIRDTKQYFNNEINSGMLFFVNDYFTHLPPQYSFMLICNILAHSYSSIDCFVYLTVNRYVTFPGSHLANLIWMPSYSEKREAWLPDFVNNLGAKWFNFIQSEIGPFDDHAQSDQYNFIRSASYIKHSLDRA